MEIIDKNGIYLYKKASKDLLVIKDLMKILKIEFPTNFSLFSYIEAKSSLHEDLTLWENLQLVTGSSNWREFCQTLSPCLTDLLKYIKNCHIKTSAASNLEKFIVSLIQGFQEKENILIDINEDLLNLETITVLKKIFLNSDINKKFILASANPGMWTDCAHTLIHKDCNHNFQKTKLNKEESKIPWVA